MRPLWPLLVISLVACEERPSLELLSLSSIEPRVLVAGGRLVVRGHGFPVGRGAWLELRGTLHRPGGMTQPVASTIELDSADEETLEAAIDELTLEAIGGRGTFRGRARVSFRAALDREVAGSIDGVVLDVLGPRARGDVIELAEPAGLELEAARPGEDGLLVRAVLSDSMAARAGIAVGDRVLEIEGLRPLAVEELAVARGTPSVRLEVERHGLARPLAVRLDLASLTAPSPPMREVRLAQLAALIALTALLWSGRGARLLARVASARRPSRWIVTVLSVPIAVLLAVLGSRLPYGGMVLVVALARGAAFVAGARDRSELLDAALRSAGLMLAALGLHATATVWLGSTLLGELSSHQGALPWEWLMLRAPAGVGMIALVHLLASGAPSRWRIADDLAVALVGGSSAIALLGGAGTCAPLELVMLGAGAATLSFLLACVRERLTAPGGTLAAGSLVIASAAVAAAQLWSVLEPARYLEQAFAQVGVGIAVVVVMRIALAREAPPPRPAHPLL